MINKRGQGISTNAIILIILGVVVLAVLIVGFALGWDKIAPWISGNNVDTIVTACETACSTNSIYDFCMVKRDLKAEDTKLKDVTCNYLANNQTIYGVNKCSSIPCEGIMLAESSEESLGDFCTEDIQVVQTLIENTLISYSCPVSA